MNAGDIANASEGGEEKPGDAVEPPAYSGLYPEQKPPGMLYHYTSAAGVVGMFENREVWATSVQFVNDSSEIVLALDLLRSMLLERANREGSDSAKTLSGIVEQLTPERFKFDPDTYSQTTVCAFSLSKHDNQLSQWRVYCPETGGYALGFSTEDLRQSLSEAGFWHLARCR